MARKLLLADDSITIQKVVELVLAEEGYEIKAVNNGEDALAAVATFNPDIVLADVEMPKMNGYQLCEKIKTNPATRNIPVILLSGAFEPLDEELSRQVKADSFVVKPFESQELISKINASLVAASVTEEEAVMAEESGAIAEAVSAEEDLWAMEAMEAVSPEVAAEAELTTEAVPEGEAAFTEAFETAESEEINIAEEFEAVEAAELKAEQFLKEEIKVPSAPVIGRGEKIAEPAIHERVLKIPEIELPSKEELSLMFKKSVDEKVTSFLSSMDIKNVLLSAITPALKDSVEKILWELIPELTEKVVRETLQSTLTSLSKEVEKVIWEAVPDVAETLIAKEIEKIRSEI